MHTTSKRQGSGPADNGSLMSKRFRPVVTRDKLKEGLVKWATQTSAEGAAYGSQGQARSAMPPDRRLRSEP